MATTSSTSSNTIPIVMTSSGVQPQSPTSILTQLLANVAATNPGYTANLPGTLIEDISSTDVGAILLCDSAFVELVNSIAPNTANSYLLTLLGAQAGIPQGVGYNTNVNVVFQGPPGFVIPRGFLVSDGTYIYAVTIATIIPSSGQTGSVYCLAQLSGSWAVGANTVTELVTAPPTGVTLTVTNPLAGVPGAGDETVPAYQSRVVQAGLAQCQGMTTALRTAIQQISGVQSNLVSVLLTDGQWEIIVGGGDPYQVGFAIFTGLGDISNIVGSTLTVSSITKANPGVVTTNLNHGYSSGQVIQINGIVGMTELNGVNLTITVLTAQSFSIGVNTTAYTTYVSGGVVTPNLRNQTVDINDYPNQYPVTFVIPPQQTVSMTITWNTTSSNIVSNAAIAAAAQPNIVSYINAIVVGQPLNLLDIQNIFQTSIASILPLSLLISLTFSVTVDGESVSPEEGTDIIVGDPESYWFTTAADIIIDQA